MAKEVNKSNNLKKLKKDVLTKTKIISGKDIDSFSQTARNFFASAFNIKYQFTLEELKKALVEKREFSKVKEKIESFIELLTKAEYDKSISKKELLELKRDFREIAGLVEIKKVQHTKKRIRVGKILLWILILLIIIAPFIFVLENQEIIDLTEKIPFEKKAIKNVCLNINQTTEFYIKDDYGVAVKLTKVMNDSVLFTIGAAEALVQINGSSNADSDENGLKDVKVEFYLYDDGRRCFLFYELKEGAEENIFDKLTGLFK